MPVTAKLRYLHIAPRKVRLVADLIRGKSVEEARTTLGFTVKKAAKDLMKLLKQAVASARHNFQLDESNLYISKITVDEGPKYKRWMPRARGQASGIQKKTSHVTLILDATGKEPKKVKEVKKVKKVEVEERRLSSPPFAKAREKVEKVKAIPKVEKPKFRPKIEIEKPKVAKPSSYLPSRPASRGSIIEKGIRKIFRRKAF